MADKWGVNTTEWKKMQEKLQKISQNSKDDSLAYFLKGFMVEMAERVIAKTKPRTPVDTGALRQAWILGDVHRDGNNISVEILNGMEYATFIEYGHKIVRNGIEVGWCNGRFMLTISINEIRNQIPARFAVEWSNFCKRWGL